MKSIFRSTALLSGSSAVSILLTLASTKVLATILQPLGYGYYGLLQSFVAVTSLLAGVGMATGLVRLGAGAAAAGDHASVAKIRAGAWLLTIGLGAVAMAVLVACREPLSRWALGGPEHQYAIVLMGVALWFTVAANVQIGVLNAWHRVEALAALGVVTSALTATFSIAAVLLWHQAGIVPAIMAGAFASWIASRLFMHRSLEQAKMRVPFSDAFQSARSLLSFGIPFTASALVGSGVQLALPMIVLHLLNTEAVAYYKAAAAISVGYLGFLVTAMGQDYYPRLSAVRDQPGVMASLIREQYRLVMLLAAPMVLVTLALVPYLVPLVYSRRFAPAAEVLEWQLIGDLFKFSSWTMSFAILAHSKPSVYFLTESIGGVLTLSTAWLGVRFFGLPGLGIAFVATYAAYYAVVRTILRHELPAHQAIENWKLMLPALAAALMIRIVPSTPLSNYRTVIALGLAVMFGCYSLRILWTEYMANKATRWWNAVAANEAGR